MTNLRNLLRCYAMGMSIKSISSAFHVSRNTVRKYQESGLTPEQLLSMREGKLQELFLDNCNRSRSASPRMEEQEALIPEYVKRLSRKGVTVKSLHEEKESVNDGGAEEGLLRMSIGAMSRTGTSGAQNFLRQ